MMNTTQKQIPFLLSIYLDMQVSNTNSIHFVHHNFLSKKYPILRPQKSKKQWAKTIKEKRKENFHINLAI